MYIIPIDSVCDALEKEFDDAEEQITGIPNHAYPVATHKR